MSLRDRVAALLREVAREIIVPRFRALGTSDIAEKSPGEIVTVADLEAEARLAEGLAAIGLGARIVGEEAAARDPGLLEGIGDGLAWLIDPLDGTANFAAGRAPFGTMVALVEEGIPIEAWMLDPLTGRLCHAARGRGATCDGITVRSCGTGKTRAVAALATQFMPADLRARVHAHAGAQLDLVPIPRCAAESYPRLALGDNDIALFQRILPWDHAAGTLFLTEAGGKATHWDGTPYRVGGPGTGLLAAAGPVLWQSGAELLLGPEAGLVKQKEFETC